MNWLKETWWIVKQLFTKVKADKVEYKHMDHYPFSGYSAMSWCGYLLSRKPESQIKPTTLGYIKGNIQLVCMAVNQMKSDLTIEQLKYFCKSILEYKK